MYKLWLGRLRFRKIVQIFVSIVSICITFVFQFADAGNVYSFFAIMRMFVVIYFILMIHEARVSLNVYSRKATVQIKASNPIATSSDPIFNKKEQGCFVADTLSKILRDNLDDIYLNLQQNHKSKHEVLRFGYKLAPFLKYYLSHSPTNNPSVLCLDEINEGFTTFTVSFNPLWYTVLSNNSFGRGMYIGGELLYDTSDLSPIDHNGSLLPLHESNCANGLVIDVFAEYDKELYFLNGQEICACYVKSGKFDPSLRSAIHNTVVEYFPYLFDKMKILGIYRSEQYLGQPHISVLATLNEIPAEISKKVKTTESTNMLFYFLKDSGLDEND